MIYNSMLFQGTKREGNWNNEKDDKSPSLVSNGHESERSRHNASKLVLLV